MKFTTVILAALILFLNIQPVLTHDNYPADIEETCTTDGCCSNKETSCETNKNAQQNQNPNNCCNNGQCNPFEICACCFYTFIEYPNLVNTKIFTESLKPTLKNENNTLSYISDFWHPPELG